MQPIDDQNGKPDVYHIWPENVTLWHLWFCLQTQWRCGLNGREGLDYAGVYAYLRNVARIKARDIAQTFNCLQAMETAALNAWAEKAKQENR